MFFLYIYFLSYISYCHFPSVSSVLPTLSSVLTLHFLFTQRDVHHLLSIPFLYCFLQHHFFFFLVFVVVFLHCFPHVKFHLPDLLLLSCFLCTSFNIYPCLHTLTSFFILSTCMPVLTSCYTPAFCRAASRWSTPV